MYSGPIDPTTERLEHDQAQIPATAFLVRLEVYLRRTVLRRFTRQARLLRRDLRRRMRAAGAAI